MVKKCRGVAEIAVMELDLRTPRPQPPDFDHVPASTSLLSPNKSKIISAGTDFESFLRLRSRRRRRILLPENNSFAAAPPEIVLRQPLTTSTSHGSEDDDGEDDGDDASAFCCSSSNGCSEVVEESRRVIEFVDLEEDENNDDEQLAVRAHENYSSRERREATPSSKFRSPQSDDMESPAAKSEATSGDRSLSSSLIKIMPTDSDLEEFFISAEKNLQKCFAEKYNYDIVEDVPLEGRYEWIRLKP